MKKIILKIVLIILLVLVGFQITSLLPSKNKPLREDKLLNDINYSDTPTLLIPGWAGNKWTYNRMIDTYQDENVAQKTMTIHVSPTGKVKVHGTVKNKKNAMIQVLFDWNYTASYRPQTKWLTNVMLILHDKYHINKMNVIAHSWGGSAWLHALAGSSKLQKEIKFSRVILLGVPVEESFDDISYKKAKKIHSTDGNYQKLVAQTKYLRLRAKIKFYNFLGEIKNENTDGSVPHVQSEFLQKIVNPKWAYYSQMTFEDTSHSGLHSDEKVLKEIEQILWEKEK